MSVSDSKSQEDRMVHVARLWSSAQPVVSAMIAGTVFDFHDAEDLVAEVAETAVRKFDQYDPTRPFAPWALGIARNLLLHYYQRRSDRRQAYLDDQALESIASAHLEIADELPARQAALQECIQAIRGKSRRVLEMRYGHDLKPEAVADALNMSRNAVWVMLHRIRTALRNCIEHKLTQAKQ